MSTQSGEGFLSAATPPPNPSDHSCLPTDLPRQTNSLIPPSLPALIRERHLGRCVRAAGSPALPSGSFQPKTLPTFLLQAKGPGWVQRGSRRGSGWQQGLLNPPPVQRRQGRAGAAAGRQTLARCRAVSGQEPQLEASLRTTGFTETGTHGTGRKNCPPVLARLRLLSPTAQASGLGFLLLAWLCCPRAGAVGQQCPDFTAGSSAAVQVAHPGDTSLCHALFMHT